MSTTLFFISWQNFNWDYFIVGLRSILLYFICSSRYASCIQSSRGYFDARIVHPARVDGRSGDKYLEAFRGAVVFYYPATVSSRWPSLVRSTCGRRYEGGKHLRESVQSKRIVRVFWRVANDANISLTSRVYGRRATDVTNVYGVEGLLTSQMYGL